MEDSVVRDTAAALADLRLGRGMGLELGPVATVTRSAFLRSLEHGVFVGGVGSHLNLTDSAIEKVSEPPAGGNGFAVLASDGGSASLTRVGIEDTEQSALMASGVGSRSST